MKNISSAQFYIPKNNFFILSRLTHNLINGRANRVLKISSLYVCNVSPCFKTPSFSIFLTDFPILNDLDEIDINMKNYLYKDMPLPNSASIIVFDKNNNLIIENTQSLYIECSHINSISSFINYDEIY